MLRLQRILSPGYSREWEVDGSAYLHAPVSQEL
jgi:hypothetical protein